jgi:hypothetical protein
MHDVAWCHAKLAQWKDDLNDFANAHTRLGDELEEARLLWTDTAARKTFARFIDPYRSEIRLMLQCLESQLTSLRDTASQMDQAEQPAKEIHQLSEESAQLRQQADLEITAAHHQVDLALYHASAADDLAEQALHVLSRIR